MIFFITQPPKPVLSAVEWARFFDLKSEYKDDTNRCRHDRSNMREGYVTGSPLADWIRDVRRQYAPDGEYQCRLCPVKG